MQIINHSELAAGIQFLNKNKQTTLSHSHVPIDEHIIKVLIWSFLIMCAETMKLYQYNIQKSTHLGNGVNGVPALRQDFCVGVIEKADEA